MGKADFFGVPGEVPSPIAARVPNHMPIDSSRESGDKTHTNLWPDSHLVKSSGKKAGPRGRAPAGYGVWIGAQAGFQGAEPLASFKYYYNKIQLSLPTVLITSLV